MKTIPEVSKSTLLPAVFIRRMVLCVVLINIFVIVLTGFLLRRSRLQDEERATVATRNPARVLEQSMGGSMDKIDVALFAVIEEFSHQYARGGLDRGGVEQVLMNLASNAGDAMADDGVITIKTSVFTMTDRFNLERGFGKAGDYACVTVSDTGYGMNEETKRKIFEPFFTTKEVGKGTGLGLSIVYGIIKQHNGYVYVRSVEGSGTAFDTCLPLSDLSGETDGSAEGRFPDDFRGNETLLLAEDDTTLNRLHQELLEEAGYQVIIVADGEEALEKFQEYGSKIELLILDVIMPKMNGKRVLEQIRAIRPEMAAIFVSGYPSDVLQEGDMMQDEFQLLMKPVTPAELLRNIRETLDCRKESRR